jgi:hypothetical protein
MSAKRTREGALTERVARLLLGAPTTIDPAAGKVRFGDISVNVVTGKFFDYEDEVSGTHIELIQRVKGLVNGQAEAWIKQNITDFRPGPLPQDLEVERALIGMLATQPELMANVEEEIVPENFAEPIHRQMFVAIAEAVAVNTPAGLYMPILLKAGGGDPLFPVFDGYTLIQYVAMVIAQAPAPPDAAHMVRSLAAELRTQANREGDIYDEADLEPLPPPFISQFGGIPFEMLDEPGPEHAHVIDGLITVGDKSVLGGASRSGKSFFAIHMAMCIATATSFFGRKVLTPGLVIYQAGEGGRGIKKRFRAWRQHFGIAHGTRIPLFILQSKVDIHSHEGDTGKLIAEVQGISRLYGKPVIALFIDTLAKASGIADENSGRDMGVVMANVDRIADAVPGCHVCLVHHMNAGGTKLRGHTSVYAGVDQVILVTKAEDSKVRTAVLDKQKDDEDGAQIAFELLQVEVGRRPLDGKPITSCVTSSIGEPLEMKGPGAAKDRTMSLTDDQTNIFNALKHALAEVGIPTPPALKLPRSIATVCTVSDWYNAYRAVASKEDAALRQSMGRASDKFIRLGIIGRTNPYVWVTGKAVAGARSWGGGSYAGGAPIQEEFPDREFAPR